MIAKSDRNKQADVVLAFWELAGPGRWFSRNDAFDANFRQHFLEHHLAAARLDYEEWMSSPEGALALVILLDQYPRNCFRDTAHAYATDGLALRYAKAAVAKGFDREVTPGLRMFLYLPFEHAEDAAEQQRSVALMAGVGDDEAAQAAAQHADIIERFGRFPHRNAVLGRSTTPEEQAFLDGGGFSG